MWLNIFNREPKAFREGWLPASGGHEIYFREFGNPKGTPVLSFHGGPGGAVRSKYAKLFNLKKYHFIQFDQRGCGNSVSVNAFKDNETQNLLIDAKRLLDSIGIKRKVIVHGVSWGSTLALLFAERYPDKVSKIAISSVFLARAEDVKWVSHESERFYPDIWDELRIQHKSKNVYQNCYNLLFSNNKRDNLKALTYLGSYEHMLGQLAPKFIDRKELDENELKSARVAFHYEKNKYFLKPNQILENIDKIKHIPTLIVHNRLDFCCPVKQAWDLHKELPKSEIIINPGYEHSSAQLLKVFKQQLQSFLS